MSNYEIGSIIIAGSSLAVAVISLVITIVTLCKVKNISTTINLQKSTVGRDQTGVINNDKQ